MQVLLEERSKAYFNFINSLNSHATKEKYKFCVEKFPESTYAHLSIYNPFYYSVGYHKESPTIRDIISHFHTSSVFFVLRDFLICGTVLHKLKKVADIPMTKIIYSFICLQSYDNPSAYNLLFFPIHAVLCPSNG